ncbi:MAG: HD-GYP domain-containing protein, partial [Peptococcaceae bacterium]|nr:HD-GYP domain-containing protein [Peptococcaceae bacterium]
MIICSMLFTITQLSPPSKKPLFKQIFVLFGSYYVLTCSALTSIVDQYLHSEIIVFVIAILAYSLINIQRPLMTVFMYLLPYIVLIVGTGISQQNPTILRGHYINGSLIVILAVFLTSVFYYSRMRDFISRKTIERQKAELEQANRELSVANHELQESLAALDESQNIIFTLTFAMESKDPNTRGHSERVVNYALAMADYLNLSEKDKTLLRRAAVLHDIGKIGIPDYILNKPLPLTEEEWKTVKLHPVRGEAICSKLKFAQEILPIIRHHHERYDGTGYPDGLKGENIPFLARIVSIADTVDAITSQRTYRMARSMEYALDELRRCSGTQFDPFLAEAFIEIYG